MEKNSRIIKTLLIVLAALIIIGLIVAAAIVSLGKPDEEDGGKNENTEGDQSGENIPEVKTVSYYFAEKGFEVFLPSYVDIIEDTFRRKYYKPDELPSSEELAEGAASLYDEYCRGKVDETDHFEVTYALIDCMIETIGDKYAFYRTKEETEDYVTNMSGSFAGIGVDVLRNSLENTILIEAVHIGAPAESAGILPGDYIIGVDGLSINDIGAESVINKVRGEVGTTVSVTVKRGESSLTFEMVRAPLTETTVSTSYLEGGSVALIRITGFKDNTSEQFAEAVNEVESSGAKSVIFDLRGNGGGYLTAVSEMLSYLVPDGTPIASFTNGKGALFAYSGTDIEPTDHVLTLPSAVVVNENSASASELFTAAMRDYNDMELLESTVVGTVTFKKGVMQSTYDYSDGSSLTLTISLYNPPSGINFDGVGVSPDITVNEGEDFIEKALSALKE
ncbi:MAG: PDZ domain-containing protein [Clostridia bacterium]|nr:PDZ domain-containing protein [Clostridia bacterium]